MRFSALSGVFLGGGVLGCSLGHHLFVFSFSALYGTTSGSPRLKKAESLLSCLTATLLQRM